MKEQIGQLMKRKIPRLITVNPRLRKKMEKQYPDLKPFFSDKYLCKETVFYVGYEDDTHVDEQGIIHLNMEFFKFMVSALNEFFRTYRRGAKLESSFAGFIALLSGELSYGKELSLH